jgi:hypothetical protein
VATTYNLRILRMTPECWILRGRHFGRELAHPQEQRCQINMTHVATVRLFPRQSASFRGHQTAGTIL